MKKTSLYSTEFHKKTSNLYDKKIKDYNAALEIAPNDWKGNAHDKFRNAIFNDYPNLLTELGSHSRFFIELEEDLRDDKHKTFDGEFDRRLEGIPKADRHVLIDKLSNLRAYEKLFEFLNSEHRKYHPIIVPKENKQAEESPLPNKIPRHDIKWIGETELEFVQLIYGLYEAKYLTNDKEEITNLVKEVANAFNIELGNNWPSNLSKSINNRSPNYAPEIFERLKNAFENYRLRLINKPK